MTKHGTRSCYMLGCRRSECRAAHARYMNMRRNPDIYGDPSRVSSAQWASLLRALTMPLYTLDDLAKLTGVPYGLLKNVRSGRYSNMNRATAERLLPVLDVLPEEPTEEAQAS